MRTPAENLGAQLKGLREFAGLTTRQLADATEGVRGLSQAMIVRIEGGQKAPSRPVILAWAKATGASRETRDSLVEQAEAIYTQVKAWRNLGDGTRHMQEEVHAREQTSSIISNYQPFIIPGLLQTRAYAAAVMPLIDVVGRFDHAAAVEERIKRQQLLMEPGRTFRFIVGEGAFHFNPGLPREQFVEQVRRVAMLAELETVDLAILPTARTGAAVVLAAFVIAEGNDDRVSVELPHASSIFRNDQDIEVYWINYERLLGASVTGQDAIAQIQRIANELQASAEAEGPHGDQ